MTYEELLKAKKEHRPVQVSDGRIGKLNGLGLRMSYVEFESDKLGTIARLQEFPNEQIQMLTLEELALMQRMKLHLQKPDDALSCQEWRDRHQEPCGGIKGGCTWCPPA